jgi:catalase
MVAALRNASEALARKVAEGLGMDPLPDPLPQALAKPAKPEVTKSPALSLMAHPGETGIRGRKVAIVVADGVDATAVARIQEALLEQGALGRVIAPRIGPVAVSAGEPLDADGSLENEPGFLFDALVVADGEGMAERLARAGQAKEFVMDAYRHCKPMLMLGEARTLLERAGVPLRLPDGGEDPTLVVGDAGGLDAFLRALAGPRNFARETDPPLV